MDFRSITQRWMPCGAALILIGVAGLLCPAPAAAQGEGRPAKGTEIEIDLSNRSAWVVRMRGQAPVEADGNLRWPLTLEGGSPVIVRAFSHQRAGAPHPDSAPTGAVLPPRFDAFEPGKAGYRPGERIDFAITLEIHPLADGQLDQAMAFEPADDDPLSLSIIGRSETVNARFEGFTVASSDPGGRLRLERPERRSRYPALSRFATGPRLMLSSHESHAALAAWLRGRFPAPVPVVEATFEPAAIGVIAREIADSLRPRLRPANGSRRSLDAQLRAAIGGQPDGGIQPDEPLALALAMRDALAARGIVADLVFGNRRAMPDLPGVPVFAFDTVLLHIPAAGRYIDPDPAANLALSPKLAGHQALRLGQSADVLVRLPQPAIAPIHIRLRAEMQIAEDGSLEGHSVTEAFGPAADILRQLSEALLASPGQRLLQQMVLRQGLQGEAHLGPSEDNPHRYSQHLSFRMHPVQSPDLVLEVPLHAGPRLFRPPFVDMLPALQQSGLDPVRCQPFLLEQEIVFHLPDRRAVVDRPKDVSIALSSGRYQASYRADGRRVTVERILEVTMPGPLCQRDVIQELAPLIRIASRDFSRRLHLRSPGG